MQARFLAGSTANVTLIEQITLLMASLIDQKEGKKRNSLLGETLTNERHFVGFLITVIGCHTDHMSRSQSDQLQLGLGSKVVTYIYGWRNTPSLLPYVYVHPMGRAKNAKNVFAFSVQFAEMGTFLQKSDFSS